MHLADLKSFCEAQDHVGAVYAYTGEWTDHAILNVEFGQCSSGRTIIHTGVDGLTVAIARELLQPEPVREPGVQIVIRHGHLPNFGGISGQFAAGTADSR